MWLGEQTQSVTQDMLIDFAICGMRFAVAQLAIWA